MKSLKFLLANKFKVKSILNKDAIYTPVRKIQSWESVQCVNDATHYLCYSLFRILNKLLSSLISQALIPAFLAWDNLTERYFFFLFQAPSWLCKVRQQYPKIFSWYCCCTSALWGACPHNLPTPGESSQTEHTAATARWTFSRYKRPNFFHWNLCSSPLSCLRSSVSSSSLSLQVLVQGDCNCPCPFCFKKHQMANLVFERTSRQTSPSLQVFIFYLRKEDSRRVFRNLLHGHPMVGATGGSPSLARACASLTKWGNTISVQESWQVLHML